MHAEKQGGVIIFFKIAYGFANGEGHMFPVIVKYNLGIHAMDENM